MMMTGKYVCISQLGTEKTVVFILMMVPIMNEQVLYCMFITTHCYAAFHDLWIFILIE